MANAKKSCEAPPVPGWMVSYGDMMGLLLCFFIMLVSMSEIRSDERSNFKKVLLSLQEAFGFQGGSSTVSSIDSPGNALLARLEEITLQNFKMNNGNATDEGVEGTQNTVKRIREGIEFTMGGPVSFEAGSAELRDPAKAALREISDYIRGENNKIEIRGHATRSEAGEGKPFADERELAYARAKAVADYLVTLNVRADRLRRVDCGSSEPLILRAYDERTKQANRRVEIIVNQSLAQQFEGGEGEVAPPAPTEAPGGSVSESPTQEPVPVGEAGGGATGRGSAEAPAKAGGG